MRILILDQFSELGGAQRCLLDLLPALEAAGWEPHVALPGRGSLTERLRDRRIEVHPVSLHNYSLGRKTLLDVLRLLGDLGAMAPQLRGLVERLNPAVVYVNGPRLMPAVAFTRLDRPVIFHSHNYVSVYNGLPLVRAAIRKTSATVIAASHFLALQWERARVIYNGVPAPARERSPGGEPRIGMIGRLAPQKKQREFVEAAAELAHDFPHARFRLCGDALFGDIAGQHYKQQILAKAPPSLEYLGWRDAVDDVLAELDLLVVPSSGEGLPRVILEAMAARVPVLACASGGIPEVIVEDETGFLLPQVVTVAELTGRLRELLGSPERLAATAEAGHRLWLEKFTVQRYQAEVLEAVVAAVEARTRQNSQEEISPSSEVESSAAG